MKRILVLAATLFLPALPLAHAPAQEAVASAQEEEFVVRDIRIEGLQRISEGAVLNYLPVNIGDTLDAGDRSGNC